MRNRQVTEVKVTWKFVLSRWEGEGGQIGLG